MGHAARRGEARRHRELVTNQPAAPARGAAGRIGPRSFWSTLPRPVREDLEQVVNDIPTTKKPITTPNNATTRVWYRRASRVPNVVDRRSVRRPQPRAYRRRREAPSARCASHGPEPQSGRTGSTAPSAPRGPVGSVQPRPDGVVWRRSARAVAERARRDGGGVLYPRVISRLGRRSPRLRFRVRGRAISVPRVSRRGPGCRRVARAFGAVSLSGARRTISTVRAGWGDR